MSVKNFLVRYADRAEAGDAGSYFLARAYLSWCREGESHNCNLAGFNELGPDDRQLFWDMLHLREQNDWNDELAFELEQRLLHYWKMGEEKSQENSRQAELQTGEDDLDPDDDEFGDRP